MDYLLKNNIPFCIRIKDNTLVNWGSQRRPLKAFFSHLNENETRPLYHIMNDSRIQIVGKKIEGEYLIICSNISKNQERVLKTYKQRWDIERLFKNMKTQGFNLENTHMKDLKRLSKLMVIVAVSIFLS